MQRQKAPAKRAIRASQRKETTAPVTGRGRPPQLKKLIAEARERTKAIDERRAREKETNSGVGARSRIAREAYFAGYSGTKSAGADAVGVTPRSIEGWESETMQILASQLEKEAAAYLVSFSWLQTGEGPSGLKDYELERIGRAALQKIRDVAWVSMTDQQQQVLATWACSHLADSFPMGKDGKRQIDSTKLPEAADALKSLMRLRAASKDEVGSLCRKMLAVG